MTSPILEKTTGELVEEALRDARAIKTGQPIRAKDFFNGLTSANNIIKHWQAQGYHLWGETEGIIPLITGQAKYLLGPNGAEVAEADSFFNTTLTADQIATDTTLTVASTTGMVAAPDILLSDVTTSTQDWTAINSATLSVSSGLVVTNGAASAGGAEYTLDTTVGQTYNVRIGYTKGTSVSMLFEVLNGLTVAGSDTLTATGTTELTITAVNSSITFRATNTSAVITEDSTVSSLNYVDTETGSRIGQELDDGTRQWTFVLTVPSSTSVTILDGLMEAASSGKSTYSYVNQVDRPLRIGSTRYADTITGSEIEATKWSRSEYFNQPDKTDTGTVTQFYYDPQLSLGALYVWGVAGNVNNILRFTYDRPLLISSNSEDSLDMPSEWFMALKNAVTVDIGPQYGVPTEAQIINKQNAAESLNQVLGYDEEETDFQIQVDFR